MDAEPLKHRYGREYPAAVMINGVRMVLQHDGRFARHYQATDTNAGATLSKFEDGSAQITADQLEKEWGTLSGRDRQDFCMACSWLIGQPDLPDMLRFIMKQSEPMHWSEVALSVAYHLPQDEAFRVLSEALARVSSHTANLTQGIAATKHPEAGGLLRRHLEHLWKQPDLWADDSFNNWTAFDATCCIAHLLELGDRPGDFEAKVQALAKHVCAGNRESCSTFLHQYYGWLPKPEIPPFAA